MARMAMVVAVVAMSGVPTGLAAQTSGTADPREANLTAYVELLRSDVRAQKVAILTELMELTEAEDAVFWPIYREYDAELSKLNDERLANIKEYAANYGSVTDALADKLARKALDIERRRTGLLEKYYDRVKTSVSPKAAVRFLQVEYQLLLLIDLQIAASLPVVK
jgi:hypothetical protein